MLPCELFIEPMQRDSVIELGVLGLLAERDASPADLQDRFNHNFGRHQFVGRGRLDPTLARLRESDHVTAVHTAEAGTCSLTERGRDRLQTLLRGPVAAVDDPSHRPHFLVKLGFLHHLPPDEQAAELAHLEDQFHAARNEWLDIAATHREEVSTHDGYRLDLIELTADLLDAQLRWVRRLREDVEPAQGPTTATDG